MEKKTTRRIIGVLVVVALVIILLPLMFNNTETQSPIQTSEAKAPPFPSNEIETARASDTSSLIPPSQSGALISRIVAPSKQQQAPFPVSTLAAAPAPVVMAETVTNTTSQTLSQPAPAQNAQAQASDPATLAENTFAGSNQGGNSYTGSANPDALSAQNADLNSLGSTDMMSIRPVNELSASTTPNAAAQENVIVIDSDSEGNTTAITRDAAQADLNNNAQTAATAPTVRTITTTTTTPAPAAAVKRPHVRTTTVKTSVVSAENSSPANLKKGAWIVQLGSFKNKINAERLTNSLRARGYKAFTRETRGNGQIRVFVGPENQQVAAASLANKLEQEINLRGIVMSSQSLA